MTEFNKQSINKVKRHPERGLYDKETIYEIVDETIFCHVSFVQDGRPFIIPVLHARQGDNILLHGATSSRLMRHLGAGNDICMAMTILDGIVLARSIFCHSSNYRSVVLFGEGAPIEDEQAKMDALEVFTEQLLPGRWGDARIPSPKELKATAIVSVPIALGSAKYSEGPPNDEEEDYDLPVWAGTIPIKQQYGVPVADPRLREDIELPDYVLDYTKGRD